MIHPINHFIVDNLYYSTSQNIWSHYSTIWFIS